MTVLEWLLDSDPAVRWQVLRDLADAPGDVVAAERARVATEGWGARLLALRGADGQWAGGACFPASGWDPAGGAGQPWTATLPTLALLRLFGLDPSAPAARETGALVREHCRWEYDDRPFFDGEIEPCINGRTVAIGAWLGEDVDGIVARLLSDQLDDGGWNCEAERGSTRSSFDSTMNVVEGLLAHETATGGSAEAGAARRGVPARAGTVPASAHRRTGPRGLFALRVPAAVAPRRPPGAGALPGGRRRSGPAPERCPRAGAVQAAGRRNVAAGRHPRRCRALPAGGRRRTQPVEHPAGAAGAPLGR